MKNEHKFITTPIYYVNGAPHVGHAHTSVMGDILKREFQLQNKNVFFTTGVDEHGQKNQKAIEESGLTAQEYLDNKCEQFKSLADELNVNYDFFVRTTNKKHETAVQYVLDLVNQKGLIVSKEYEGLYCVGCEMYKTQSDLDENGCCVDHQTKPVVMKEKNYFFKLSVYQDWLIDYIKTHPDWIQPTHYANEILNLLDKPLPDLCISRPKERCTLGIELPFDKNYVAYVWFDALINYISSIGYPQTADEFECLWGNSIHLMAKDIIKTHCIYWPIMLKAIGLNPQQRNYIHGYWTGEGGLKMSKTIGNVVDPFGVVEEYGADAFRYFLARSMGENDSQMSKDIIKSCYNYELVNVISNGLYRIIKLAFNTWGGVYPVVNQSQEDSVFLSSIYSVAKELNDEEPSLVQINSRAKKALEVGKSINMFFDKKAPWILAKSENQSAFISCILTCIEALRILAEILWPIMPTTSEKMLSSLGVDMDMKNYKLVDRKLQGGELFGPPSIIFLRK